MGATIGSVVATKNAVIPAAVGVDIGCGMMAAKLPFTASQLPDNLKGLRSEIEWSVPVGFNWHKEPTPEAIKWFGSDACTYFPHPLHDEGRMQKSLCQLGTLGGGNHFVEVCLDTENQVWVMLHSGSRGIGNDLAKIHIEIAKGLFGDSLKDLGDADLAYLAEGTPEFAAYWRDLQWAQAYAFTNREIMMTRTLRAVAKVLLGDWQTPILPLFQVNCHHNYAERETHYGEECIVTRKGAVRARSGDYGIIPGSMGARSFIVRGLGNPDSFSSCSHGAGRRMSRTQAKKQFTEADLVAQTAGVECRKDKGVIDEIPGAYKDIQQVMDNQSDLVEIVAELKQVLCIKG
jgi:tRNA-splicing ligase RtcB